MDSVDVEGSEGDSDEHQGQPSPTSAPPSPNRNATAQIPPVGSGARLAYLLGVEPSPSSSRGTETERGGLPPTGNGRKRRHVAVSSGRNVPVQKVKKTTAGDKRAQKAKSPIGTSCSSETPVESVNEVSDDDDDVVEVNAAAAAARGASRRLTSDVWLEMKKEYVNGEWKGICNYCHKPLSAKSKSGTSHLRDHLKTCTLRQLKLRSKSKTGKSFTQPSLRMTAQADGKVNVETYSFDQSTAREELGNMIVLHDYPLSIVDHAGFRRFVGALQPLFHLHTRNTIRKDIIERYDKEKSKAIEYMTMLQSRVSVTTDMWTADSQKKGYMAVTGHFVDESWKLRSILMGFIYVPAPHTGDVIAEQNEDESMTAL